MNKKLLYSIPLTALAIAAVVAVLQTGSSFQPSASASTGKVISDNPTVVMQNWQETGQRTKGSKFVP
jgi:hypothetical protein